MIRLTFPWVALASDNDRNKRRGGKAHGADYRMAREAIHMHALDQVRGERPAFAEGAVEITLRFYPPSWRPDCHDTFKVLFDSIEGVVYTNDRQIRSLSHLVVDTDPDNPRVEVTVTRWLEQT